MNDPFVGCLIHECPAEVSVLELFCATHGPMVPKPIHDGLENELQGRAPSLAGWRALVAAANAAVAVRTTG
jgi:hypothetical protein